ncbi:hypothetical protein [Romboutsia sp. MSSM.1001216sp_RTP31141st1_G3_RTP31141_220114]|uniref:terminase gpP N-terminus-related DNA-binding protein n=1 Tax=unclassified Romboutsia TaxID=2626894 RepID=UPI0031B5E61F
MKETIRELYINGYNSNEIGNILGMNSNTIRSFINRNLKELKKVNEEQKKIRNDIKKNDKIVDIKKLYLKGYNAKEIAKMIGDSHSLVRKYISQNLLRKYGLEHRKTRELNKSIIRVVDNINNSYIPNRPFLNWNRQSYDYNKNGNLVFNEKRGIRPKDAPKTFYKKNCMINNTE